MSDRYFQQTFPNGLTLVAEQMTGVQSAAMTLLIPAGVSTDPEGQVGVTTVLSDLVLRGAGSRDSRALTDYLDFLGLQRSANVGVYHTRFGAAAVGPKILDSIPVYADILMRPHLPEEGFQAARDLTLQALSGLDDEPRQKLLVKLREQHFGSPLGRNSMGVAADLEKLTLADARVAHSKRYNASGAILSVAGNIDFDAYAKAVEKHLGTLPAGKLPELATKLPSERYRFEKQESEQTHIGIAYPSIPETDDQYYTARLAVEVLSGGMSGRLFTEVREKRGLCYSVWAGYTSLKGQGSIMGYAGTSNDRAQATLDTFIAELHRLTEGVTPEELSRAKIGIKSSLIMSGESTGARAGALAHDYFTRGRLRSLEEIKTAIDAVSVADVNRYLAANKPGPFTIVIVGPKELQLP